MESSERVVPEEMSGLSRPLATIGRYRVLERIGGGGMGVVYRAEDPLLGRDVAIKTSRSPGQERELFLAEARSTARIAHPNLVGVFDVGVHEETAFIAMELVRGTPISQLIRRGPSDWSIAASVAVGVAAGLTALHEAMLVHRDIKPANLMLGTSGAVKIVDFGIATSEGGDRMETFSGTPGYIPPEIVLGERPRRTADVFALGVVLHEMITGRRLFEGDSALTRTLAVTRGTAPRLPQDRAPAWFDDLIAACLLPDPTARPATAAEVLAVLRAREPYADLAALASTLQAAGPRTSGIGDGDDEADGSDVTVVATHHGPMIGRGVILSRWAGRRGGFGWLVGRAGIGKSRLVMELASRCEAAPVVLIENASSVGRLGMALGLESARDERVVREALREAAPVLVVFEDASSDPAVLRAMMTLTATEVPDAYCVFTSESGPPLEIAGQLEVVELSPLAAEESEQLLVARMRAGRSALARSLAPLASGHPLTLELLAHGIDRGDQSLVGIRQGDVLSALVERALARLPTHSRRTTELLALATDAGPSLLALHDGALLEETVGSLGQSGLLERREHGPALHPCVRAVILESLSRSGLDTPRRLELQGILSRVGLRLAEESRGPAAPIAVRSLLTLRPEIRAALERALVEPDLKAIAEVLPLLAAALEPTLQRFDEVLPTLDAAVSVLARVGTQRELLAHAYLLRAWALDHDVAAASRDVEECLRRSPVDPRVRAGAWITMSSLRRRRGADVAEIQAADEQAALIAGVEDLPDLGTIAHWGLALMWTRTGQHERARAALDDPSSRRFLGGTAGARASLLRIRVAAEVGDEARAIEESDTTVLLARSVGQTHLAVAALAYLAELRAQRGELELAESGCRQAIVLARTAHTPLPHGLAMSVLTMVCLMRGDWPRALRVAREAVTLLERCGASAGPVSRAHALLGICLALTGEERAHAAMDRALELGASLPPAYAAPMGLYVAFARAVSGEPDGWEDLEHRRGALLAAGRPGTEAAFADCVLRAAQGHLRMRVTLPGPHAG